MFKMVFWLNVFYQQQKNLSITEHLLHVKFYYKKFTSMYVFFLSLFIIYLERERETERERRSRETGRERIPSRLCTVSAEPDTGLYVLFISHKSLVGG